MANSKEQTKEIKIDIKDGYGILEFKHNFTFDSRSRFYALYAQNGTMKSSFAKVLNDYSEKEQIKDHLFNITGDCTVSGIDRKDILSFPCFDGNVGLSEEASRLVSNDDAKRAYDDALRETETAYLSFASKLLDATQSTKSESSTLVEEMYRTFVDEKIVNTITVPNIIQFLRANLPEIEKGNILFAEVALNRFTHSNFSKFIENKKYAGFFTDLAKAYDEFRQSPTYYRNGFDASNATKLIKEFASSRYFDAQHTVALKDLKGETGPPIGSVADLESVLKNDLDRIIEKYPNLKAPLGALIKDFAVGTNGDVRSIFENNANRQLLVFMGSKDRFYKNMWYGYLAACQEEIHELLRIYDQSKEAIEEALRIAKDCVSEWEEAVMVFNTRFRNLPYEIVITNKPDAIVSDLIKPVFEVRFQNPRNPSEPFREKPDDYNRLQTLTTILSNGERKALYLLNVIFRLRNQIKENRPTLVVFDDIVESFDYKNKYAFFEYLQDISTDNEYLYVVILTHNFDFYRLVYEKINPRREDQFKLILKTRTNALEVEDMFNPQIFSDIKRRASNKDTLAWIALLPLARNIVEYSQSSQHQHYKELTECLHVMPNPPKIGTIKTLIKEYSGVTECPFLDNEQIHDIIKKTASSIANDPTESFGLYKNFILAMAIRLHIENYVIANISKLQYDNVVAKAKNQTRELLKVYLNNSSDKKKETVRPLFNRALMVIDGSIHINSFMYEPLVDMGTWELKDIHNDIVSAINS